MKCHIGKICKKIRTSKFELKKRTRKFEKWFVTIEYNWKIVNENITRNIAIEPVYNPEKLKKKCNKKMEIK